MSKSAKTRADFHIKRENMQILLLIFIFQHIKFKWAKIGLIFIFSYKNVNISKDHCWFSCFHIKMENQQKIWLRFIFPYKKLKIWINYYRFSSLQVNVWKWAKIWQIFIFPYKTLKISINLSWFSYFNIKKRK